MKISFKNNITRNLLNIPGWRTDRKIVVIESDDWGTVRLSSPGAYQHFLASKFPVNECPYNSNDALESNDDMELLFEALSSVKDKNGHPAILTANNIVANPDFEKIKASGFHQYFYEPFTETLKRYPAHNQVENLYREGIASKVLMPQFHGREHVNIDRWLKTLQDADTTMLAAFDLGMFSVHASHRPVIVNELMDALDGDSAESLQGKALIVEEGLGLFKSIWGFPSKSFIAPCYIWSSSLESILADNGIKYIQGTFSQLCPTAEPGYRYKIKHHYQGQQNKHSQYYLIRNVFFEPSTNRDFDWVGDCIHRIETAFRWHKPAIISSHRVNFMGSINEQNRTESLALLKSFLKEIIKRWPEVEFISSDQLGDIMADEKAGYTLGL